MIVPLRNGQFVNRSEGFGIPQQLDWNTILVEDLNGDAQTGISSQGTRLE